MPTVHSIILRCAKSNDVTELDFHETATGKSQKRFSGRNVLKPDIDLNDFTCAAVVDWLDVMVRVGRPTQFQWVKKVVDAVTGQSCHVKPLNETGVKDGTVYRVRFQEPRLTVVRKAIEAVVSSFNYVSRPEVVGMEVSIDFTPKSASAEMRSKLVGVLQRHHMPGREMMFLEGTRPRFSWGRGRRSAFVVPYSTIPSVNESHMRSNENDKPAAVDATFYVGNRDRPPMWRTMDKIVDRQNRTTGRHLQLQERDKRVRIEVTLGAEQLSELGLRWIDDLDGFNFGPLQKGYFQFMQPTFFDTGKFPIGRRKVVADYNEAQRRTKFLNAGVLGLDAMDDILGRERSVVRKEMASTAMAQGRRLLPISRVGTGAAGTMAAYEQLNAKVVTALRHLGPKFRREEIS